MKKIIYFSTLFVGLVSIANAASEAGDQIPSKENNKPVTFQDVCLLSPVPTMSESHDPFAEAPPLFLTQHTMPTDNEGTEPLTNAPVDDDVDASPISSIKELFVVPDNKSEEEETTTVSHATPTDTTEEGSSAKNRTAEAVASAPDWVSSEEEETSLEEALLKLLKAKGSLHSVLCEALQKAKSDEEETTTVRTPPPVAEDATEDETYPEALLGVISPSENDGEVGSEALAEASPDEGKEDGMERTKTTRYV